MLLELLFVQESPGVLIRQYVWGLLLLVSETCAWRGVSVCHAQVCDRNRTLHYAWPSQCTNPQVSFTSYNLIKKIKGVQTLKIDYSVISIHAAKIWSNLNAIYVEWYWWLYYICDTIQFIFESKIIFTYVLEIIFWGKISKKRKYFNMIL